MLVPYELWESNNTHCKWQNYEWDIPYIKKCITYLCYISKSVTTGVPTRPLNPSPHPCLPAHVQCVRTILFLYSFFFGMKLHEVCENISETPGSERVIIVISLRCKLKHILHCWHQDKLGPMYRLARQCLNIFGPLPRNRHSRTNNPYVTGLQMCPRGILIRCQQYSCPQGSLQEKWPLAPSVKIQVNSWIYFLIGL